MSSMGTLSATIAADKNKTYRTKKVNRRQGHLPASGKQLSSTGTSSIACTWEAHTQSEVFCVHGETRISLIFLIDNPGISLKLYADWAWATKENTNVLSRI